jgi:hypothetical protein
VSNKGVSTIRPEGAFKLTPLKATKAKSKAEPAPAKAAGYTSMLTGKKGVMCESPGVALTNSASRFRKKA